MTPLPHHLQRPRHDAAGERLDAGRVDGSVME